MLAGVLDELDSKPWGTDMPLLGPASPLLIFVLKAECLEGRREGFQTASHWAARQTAGVWCAEALEFTSRL